jgi:hypothetical protein
VAITNPFSVLLFTNRPETVQGVRQTASAHPSAPVWWTWIFATILSFAAPLQHMIQHKTLPHSWHQGLVVCVLLLAIEVFGTFFMSGWATWGIRRQQRKSWGIQLPEDEPRVLWFRPGVWVGAATSYAMCIVLKILYACVALLLILVSQPQQMMSMASTMNTVIGVLSLLYFSYAISYFYGIPKRLFVFRYILISVILVSIVGIVLAVVLGQYAQYERRDIQQKHWSRHMSAIGVAPGIADAPAGMMVVPHAAVPRAAATHVAAGTSKTTGTNRNSPITLLEWVRRDDARCLAGLPLSAPWLSSGQVSATVVSFVSKRDVPRDIAWNNRALHGMLAPVYMRNQRVLVHPAGSSVGVTMLAVVSSGMRVTIGERVQMDSFHAFHWMPCTYVPNLIER